MNRFRYATVFSGINSPAVAWDEEPLSWEEVFCAEIEPFPCAVLQHQFPNRPNYGDISKFHDWPDHGAIDLICGGSPCQSFSLAGLRKGLADPRGNLALTFLAVVAKYSPTWVVWENVPGVHSSWTDVAKSAPGAASETHLAGVRNAVTQGGFDRSAGLVDRLFEEVDQSSDFDCFLAALAELGYGIATRVLDAQFIRVDTFPRAVPQRRERVVVVGHIGGAWQRAAAALFEPESMRGDSRPRRTKGQGVAGTISARTQGGGGLGTDFELAGGLVECGGRGCVDVAPTILAGGNKTGGDRPPGSTVDTCESLITEPIPFQPEQITSKTNRSNTQSGDPAPTLASSSNATCIAFPSRMSGTQAVSEPDVSTTLQRENPTAVAFAFKASHYTRDKDGAPSDVSPPLTADADKGDQDSLVFQERGRDGGRNLEVDKEVAFALTSPRGGGRAQERNILTPTAAVRRLTARECERIQGFPDDFTRIPWNGKPAEQCPDGPRYRAIGNSMATNMMRWIGLRIAAVHSIPFEKP